VNSTISITPKSTIIIILDELTGDQFQAKGTANLNFSMTPGGEMELVGNYEVESGKYNMTLAGLIKKDFEIKKGSNITWSGDILEATTNLTAVYKIKTDAEELIQDMQSIPGAARQKFDFEVDMNIKGALMKPAITFNIDMPEKEQAAFEGIIYTRLKQVNSIPSELNKQVMGLLALNSFIADDPFTSLAGSGGNFETEAFSTAGRLLTQELNDFLGDVVKDVDIDVGLDIRDDYTSGESKRKSDLKVGIAKSFANSRLSVYVGNTFALENQNQDEDILSGLAGDVNIEYMLTTDGKYRIKGYRMTEDDMTFNGTIVETGVSFMVVLEFNKLKNAFRSKKNKKKINP
jgi:translocation and assembly module TamB